MTRAAWLLALGAGLWLGCGRGEDTAPTPMDHASLSGALSGKNCLLVVLDACQASILGCYGGPKGISPNVDALAAAGVRFERAWSQASWTLPSTTSLLTGLYQETHGVQFGVGLEPIRLADAALTLAERFEQAGYATDFWSQNVFAGPAYGLDQGFERFHAVRQDGTWMAKAVAEDLARPSARPRFTYVHFRRPHSPFDAPAAALAPFGLPDYDGPATGTDADIELHNSGKRRLRGDDLLEHRALYEANVHQADADLALLLSTVDPEQTLVLLLSDHGEALDEHGWLGHNWRSYEEYVHIPFIMRAAALPGGRVIGASVMSIDVFPTLLDLFGLSGEQQALQGASLVPLLSGGPPPRREAVFSSSRVDGQGAQRLTVCDGRYKLILRRPDGKLELFDLRNDPGEQTDLSGRRPDVVARLRALLVSWSSTQRARLAVSSDQELGQQELESLRRLGYIGEDHEH